MVVECTRPRAPIGAMFGSPGPSYGLPGLTGRSNHDPSSRFVTAPAYQFGLRWINDQQTVGPGPCYMPLPKVYRNGKEVSPHCIIINSRTDPKVFNTPGPAAYLPGQPELSSRHSRPPAFSIARAESASLRRSQLNVTPGPAAYNPDQMLGRTVRSTKRTAPCIVISRRSSIGDDSVPTPGPGHYGLPCPDMYKTRAPGCTIIGRKKLSTESINTPGPAAHSPDMNVSSRQRRMPAFTFGIRHSQYCVPARDADAPQPAND